MGIERDAVRTPEAGQLFPVASAEDAGRSIGTVDMKPDRMPGTDVGDLGDGIDRARTDGPDTRDDSDRSLAAGATGLEFVVEQVRVELEVVTHREEVKVARTDAEQLDGLGHAAVRLDAGIDGELRLGRQALRPDVKAGVRVPCRGQGGDRDHRCAAHQQATRPTRQSDHLRQPADHHPLKVQGHLIAPRTARVARQSGHARQNGGPVGRRVHPGVETRMAVAEGVAEHLPDEGSELFEISPLLCPALGPQPGRQLWGHRGEDWPGADGAQMIGGDLSERLRSTLELGGTPAPGAHGGAFTHAGGTHLSR